jgi:hypothetical protein
MIIAGVLLEAMTVQSVRAEEPGAHSRADATAIFRAVRLEGNPVIRPGMPGLAGEDGRNINGASLIQVPAWIERPMGRYYLYFAHHAGKHIRLAHADKLDGPWNIHQGGILAAEEAPGQGHIASPDVHVDEEAKEIRLYFHRAGAKGSPIKGQVSFVATSRDGLHFAGRPEVLGSFYFRVFRHGGRHYALAKHGNVDGVVYRSRDGLTAFEEGPHCLPGVRHTAVWVEGDVLYVLYTKVAEAPERIYLGTMDLAKDWREWKVSQVQVLLEPETDYEGARLPLVPSSYGAAGGPVRQLRDPAFFREDGRRFVLYSVAGEQGIAIAELKRKTP